MAKTVSQVIQMAMEAISATGPGQKQFNVLRKLRIAQEMTINYGLDVPVRGSSMSPEGAAAVKNSLGISAGSGKSADRETKTARDAEEVNDGN